VLEGEAATARYWHAATDSDWRAASSRWEGLHRAPVLLLAYSSAASYLSRYAEPDKAASGLARARTPGPCPTGSATPPSGS